MRPQGSYRESRGTGPDRPSTRGGSGAPLHHADPGRGADQGLAAAGGVGTAGQRGPPGPGRQGLVARRLKRAGARSAWMMPYPARLVLLRSRQVPPASVRPVAGRLDAAEGRPAAAEDRRPESTRAA